jgi:hypothetical protein
MTTLIAGCGLSGTAPDVGGAHLEGGGGWCTRGVPGSARMIASVCPFAGLFCKPSDGLEPSTPSLPWNSVGNWSQPTATVFACFRRFGPP